MKTLLRKTILFLTVQFVFVLLISILLLNKTKTEAQVLANHFYADFFDYTFYILTHSVEFWGCLIIYILVATFKNFKFAIIGLTTYAISGLVTQILKRNIFSEFKRPTVNIDNLRLIPEFFEYEQNQNFSFPSGHTTVAFSIFIFMTLLAKNRNWGLLFGALACLVAYSRVYLSQHYFIDILVGSLIGSLVTVISFWVLNKIKFGQWAEKRFLKP